MMNKYSYTIALLMLSLILNGCSSERGGNGVVSNGVVSDDVFIADSIKKVETEGAYPSFAPYDSLTEASAEKEVSEFTLQGLAVQGGETTNYTASGDLGWNQEGETSINVATITAPAVALAFDDGGNISGVTAYFADKSYGYDSALDEDVSLSAMKIDARDITDGAQTDARNATLTVDRSEIFGLVDGEGNEIESNYMVYIGWNLERTQGDANGLLGSGKDRSYSINGSMIAGIETDAVDLPRKGDVKFIGKGRGLYSHVNKGTTSHATIFDVTTDVNFETQSINVNSANTMRCSDINDVDSCTSALSSFDFNTQETFVYITNNKIGFRGDVSLKADSSFTGTIDARFYGGRAQELGSIFAMRDETGGYYYGAFGGERDGVVADSVFDAIIGDEVVTLPASVTAPFIPIDTVTSNPYENLTDIAGTDKNVVLNALTVTKNETTTYTRTPNRNWTTDADTAQVTGLTRVTDSVASLTFTGNDKGITLYANDIYSSDDITITVDRSEIFGFDSNYMAHIIWDVDNDFDTDNIGLTADVVDINGTMLAGIQTADADIPLAGNNVFFNGAGHGTYGRLNDNVFTSDDTVFDVTAKVDFGDKNVTIWSENTCKAGNDAKCGVGGADRLDFLNFPLALLRLTDTDGAIVNHISGASTTAGDADNAKLTGTIDARFYGGATEELGGTFAFTNANSYYYGVFGAERDTFFNITFDASNIANATIPNGVTRGIASDADGAEYVSLHHAIDDSNGQGRIFTMNALSVSATDKTDYARAIGEEWDDADRDKNVTVSRVDNSLASLTIDGSGQLSDIAVYLNNDIAYSGSSSNLNQTTLSSAMTVSGFDTANISLSRDTNLFGFETTDMVYINWSLSKNLPTDEQTLIASKEQRHGMMIAGIETDFSNIPIVSSVDFTGKGRGTYGNITDNTGFDTIFDVTAEVNFATDRIVIRSENTCEAVANADCADGGVNRKDLLDFTTVEITYYDNDISGDATANGIGWVV